MIGESFINLSMKRAELKGENRADFAAMKELVALWRKSLEPYAKLLADFLEKARAEINIPFDKVLFQRGVADSDRRIFKNLEDQLGPM